MGQALYRKYRSKALSEIVGQEHITETLDKALASGRISHAYLFTGPRGVGKTSIARILAHEINRLPYSDDSSHMDIIEIDAASNNGVEDIRDLREKAAVAPTSAEYKVYIIDEVHMLSKAAFNALLKTLEEPPAHIVFILATTDAHKLPATIVSRTQRYTFKPVPQDQVVAHLRHIAERENISVDDAALALLAAHGEGSFRDSISMLDQASGQGGHLTFEFVQLLLGIPPEAGVQSLLTSLSHGDAPGVAQSLNSLYDQGFQAAAIAKVLGQTIRLEVLQGTTTLDGDRSLSLLSRLLSVASGHDPERLLEIILLDCAGAGKLLGKAPARLSSQTAAVEAPAVANPVKVAAAMPAAAARNGTPANAETMVKPVITAAPALSDVAVTDQADSSDAALDVPEAAVFDAALWPDVLTALKQKYNTLYGVVRMAEPTFSGNNLELAFGFAFHQKRLSDPKNKKIVGDILFALCGQPIHITCVVRKPDLGKPVAAAVATPPPVPTDITAISDIFGGAEVIQ